MRAPTPGPDGKYGRLDVNVNVEPGAVKAVYLDGVEQEAAVACDDREGWVVRLILTPDGETVPDVSGEALLTEFAAGEVVVEMREPAEARTDHTPEA